MPPAPELEGLRVLVVDDDPDGREAVALVLAAAGAEVSTAASVRYALASIDRWIPHVVVSDIVMPVEDGYVFIERLQGLVAERGLSIPAIALTACAHPEDRARALDAGYLEHLVKPVEPAHLLEVLAALAPAGRPGELRPLPIDKRTRTDRLGPDGAGSVVIDLRLGSDEEMIRDTARAFAQDRLAPTMRVHEGRGGVDVGLVRAYRALGFAAMEAPAEAGGQGASPLAKALVLEELGAGDAGAAFALEGAGPALQALLELGETALLRDVIAEPDLRVGFVSDGEGRLALGPATVTGTHPWSPLPSRRCAAVVVVQGDRMVLVRDGIGFVPVKPCGLAAAGACQLDFAAAPVVATTADRAAVARARAHARRFVAALLVGLARTATDYAMRYAEGRVAFGRPIAHHQGLAFLLADMATAVEGSRLALWRAAVAGGEEDGGARAAAWALAEAAEQALFVGPSAVQVLGGHGFMKDHPVEKWMRDIRTLALLDGGRDEAELESAAAEV